MTIAYWCVLIAAILPYFLTILAKVGSSKYNNHKPRECLEQLQGWHRRAYWAQLNSFEAFPAFAAAVIVAHQIHGVQENIDALAMVFIGLRILYGLLYILDKAILRSIVWTLGFGCVVMLFFQ